MQNNTLLQLPEAAEARHEKPARTGLPMTKPLDECRYQARTLAASMMDLEAKQRAEVLRYLLNELQRLGKSIPADLREFAKGGSPGPLSD
jgi:hypothetical protein